MSAIKRLTIPVQGREQAVLAFEATNPEGTEGLILVELSYDSGATVHEYVSWRVRFTSVLPEFYWGDYTNSRIKAFRNFTARCESYRGEPMVLADAGVKAEAAE